MEIIDEADIAATIMSVLEAVNDAANATKTDHNILLVFSCLGAVATIFEDPEDNELQSLAEIAQHVFTRSDITENLRIMVKESQEENNADGKIH